MSVEPGRPGYYPEPSAQSIRPINTDSVGSGVHHHRQYPQQHHQQQQYQPDSGVTAGPEDVSRRLEAALFTDNGIDKLLNRLRQSIFSATDFSKFLREKANLEERYAQGHKKLIKHQFETIRRPDARQGSYLRGFDDTLKIHDRMADTSISFASSLSEMASELQSMAETADQGRKRAKHDAIDAEKRLRDADVAMQRARDKYNQVAERYERARMGDTRTGKFGLMGKNPAQQEEVLKEQADMLDQDYTNKTEHFKLSRSELDSSVRPRIIQELSDMIAECDAGLALQMQKLASLTERHIVGNGMAVSPFQNNNTTTNTTGPAPRGLRHIAQDIDNRKDFHDYVLGNENIPSSFSPRSRRNTESEQLNRPISGQVSGVDYNTSQQQLQQQQQSRPPILPAIGADDSFSNSFGQQRSGLGTTNTHPSDVDSGFGPTRNMATRTDTTPPTMSDARFSNTNQNTPMHTTTGSSLTGTPTHTTMGGQNMTGFPTNKTTDSTLTGTPGHTTAGSGLIGTPGHTTTGSHLTGNSVHPATGSTLHNAPITQAYINSLANNHGTTPAFSMGQSLLGADPTTGHNHQGSSTASNLLGRDQAGLNNPSTRSAAPGQGDTYRPATDRTSGGIGNNQYSSDRTQPPTGILAGAVNSTGKTNDLAEDRYRNTSGTYNERNASGTYNDRNTSGTYNDRNTSSNLTNDRPYGMNVTPAERARTNLENATTASTIAPAGAGQLSTPTNLAGNRQSLPGQTGSVLPGNRGYQGEYSSNTTNPAANMRNEYQSSPTTGPSNRGYDSLPQIGTGGSPATNRNEYQNSPLSATNGRGYGGISSSNNITPTSAGRGSGYQSMPNSGPAGILSNNRDPYQDNVRSPSDMTPGRGAGMTGAGRGLPGQQAASAQNRPLLPPNRPVFGVDLDSLSRRDGSAVPEVVFQCIHAVELFGQNVEGIYRISGSAAQITYLKSLFDHDSRTVKLDTRDSFNDDIASVATLLKTFLRDLPDPLLTRAAYHSFIQAAKHNEVVMRRDSLHQSINSLPDPNYATLRVLTLHLHRLAMNSNVNRMDIKNLAIVFGPTVMGGGVGDTEWQTKVMETILNHTYEIFDPDDS